jgi:malonyl-CoA O-methyltransferase
MNTPVLSDHDIEAVKGSFSTAARTYELYAGVQREVADELSMMAASLSCEAYRILDIGCGTGILSVRLKEIYPASSVFGVDIAVPMLSEAGRRGRLRPSASDCRYLPFRGRVFDMAASSLAYQWVPDLGHALTEAIRVLRPGGIFVMSTLGPGTLKELRASYEAATGMDSSPPEAALRDAGVVRDALIDAGFKDVTAQSRAVARTYADMTSLLRALKMTGASPRHVGRGAGLSMAAFARRAGRFYVSRFPAPGKGIRATYEAIYAMGRRA